MATEYTHNFRLAKPDFRTSPWSDQLNANADRIDNLIYNAISAGNVSVFANNVLVDVGAVVYDPDLNTFFVNNTAHTTIASGSFADERVEYPDYWSVLNFAYRPRGRWSYATTYEFYDIAYDPIAGTTGICIEPHTTGSSGTMRDDPTRWVYIMDLDGFSSAVIAFDNTGTSIIADNVQDAIAELDDDLTNEIGNIESDIVDLQNQIDNCVRVDISQAFDETEQGRALKNLNIKFGQCVFLYANTTTAILVPYDGDLLTIAGVPQRVPAGGVTISVVGLTTGVPLYIYAYMASGVMTLEASTTGYTKDTTAGNVGVAVKTGDNTRTLVGMIYLTSGGVITEDAQRQSVRSWFNRQSTTTTGGFSTGRTTTSTTGAELNVEIRNYTLLWAGESWALAFSGYANTNVATSTMGARIAVDGVYKALCFATPANATYSDNLSVSCYVPGLSEGWHYATIYGQVSAGTGNFNGSLSGTVLK